MNDASRQRANHQHPGLGRTPLSGSRLAVYGLMVLGLFLVLGRAGATWAQPHQNGLRGSIPTRVPTATTGPTATPSPTPDAQVTRVLLQEVDAAQTGYHGTLDTYIDSGSPSLPVTLDGNLKLKGAGGQSVLIRFDLAGQLPANVHVVAAELVFFVDHPSGVVPRDLGVGVFRVLQQWSETEASWRYRHAQARIPWAQQGCEGVGTDRLAEPDDSRTLIYRGVYSGFDVTDGVQYLLDHPEENWGWLIKGISASTGAFTLASSRNRELGQRPMLRIDYTLSGGQTPTTTPTATQPTPGVTATATPQGGSVLVKVFHDVDQNGSLDAGEPGVAGVTVQLLNYATRQVLAQAVTAGDGTCLFGGLAAGNYRLKEINPTGYQSTTADEIRVSVGSGQSQAFFGDYNPSAPTPAATPTAMRTMVPGDGVIEVLAYRDANGNASPDEGEGIAGLPVELRNAYGALLDTEITDQGGAVRWDALPRECFTVRQLAPWGDWVVGGTTAQRCLGSQPAQIVFVNQAGSALGLPLILR
jgi:hypothetical protein